jgi:ribosome-binding protein aMBF1 (putative translation factor)
MSKSLKEYRTKLLADPEVKAAYEALEEDYTLARAIIQARRVSGLTQGELAQRMGTTQSVIARLESGKHPPSSQTLQRVAKATGTHLKVQFVTPSST